jgi:glycolate oxidase
MPASITRPTRLSQIACSIGGNVAENSGGVHCLKYGLTTNNVLGSNGADDGEVMRSAASISMPAATT